MAPGQEGLKGIAELPIAQKVPVQPVAPAPHCCGPAQLCAQTTLSQAITAPITPSPPSSWLIVMSVPLPLDTYNKVVNLGPQSALTLQIAGGVLAKNNGRIPEDRHQS